MGLPGTDDPDDPRTALLEVRGRFIAAFTAQCESVRTLLDGLTTDADEARLAGLRQIVHRITGLAGTVGFPGVSRRAAELESLIQSPAVNVPLAIDLLGGIREAFTSDLLTPPDWADVHVSPAASTIVIVEDDPDQLAVLEIHLQAAGHRTIAVTRGNQALETIADVRPALVLLDVDLPGADGYSICRTIKSTPELASIPVMFLTTKAAINERLSGLTLGADEYLIKPIDPRELLIRIRRLTRPVPPPAPPTTPSPGPPSNSAELTFDAFSTIAVTQLAREATAIALLRVPAGQRDAIVRLLAEESRRRDAIGRYDDSHLLWLLPGASRGQAVDRARDVVSRIRAGGFPTVTAGVAAADAGADAQAVIAEADEALAEARYLETPAAAKGMRSAPAASVARSLVLADDDPEVARIVDAHMQAAGFRTVLAFDGERALQAIRQTRPDVVVLDLMMPVLTGFDVLKQLRDVVPRPRIVVLSARGREDDVTRAFELGADDYIVKPFSPQELRARISRLLR